MSLGYYFRKYIPQKKHIQKHAHLRYLGNWLHNPNIWRLKRDSSAKGVAIGLFWSMMPIPMQTIFAAITAIFLRANLPLSIIFIWTTNPITAPPIYYFAYKLGGRLLNQPVSNITFDFSLYWLTETVAHIWQPLVIGCLLIGILSAIIANITIKILWSTIIKK